MTRLPAIAKYLKHSTLTIIALVLIVMPTESANIKLPLLGDASSSGISQKKEYELGRAWLKAYRSRINEHHDPLLTNYLEQLIYRLASRSNLKDRRLELIVINNPTLNAFAVPGGVIGVHTGLFLFAKSEDQISSVLAHEIAHLSQRHFSRRLDRQKKTHIGSMAGLLASLVLAATLGSDAGMAGLGATQAMGRNNSLRYSRQNEQEADRLGLQTMIAAGMNPEAMSTMFEEMLKLTRYTGSKVPEFLRSHPLTQNRVVDARNRINQLEAKKYPDNFEFHLMRARAIIAVNKNASVSLNFFEHELKDDSKNSQASLYGMLLSYIDLGDYSKAKDSVDRLIKISPNQLPYKMAEIDIYRKQEKYDIAIKKTKALLKYQPASYPLRMSLAETYLKFNRFLESERLLDSLAVTHPGNPEVWFLLAEIRGLAGNISGVHKARAAYFTLTGVFDQARDQLLYARKLLIHDYKQTLIIDQQLKDLNKLKKRMESL
jgi:predicted Zn-dependent protease|tara:strand:+ start:402 stop:1868 length:1467 start_codon:yes stop_codon:yes gene_type:complete